MKRMRTWATALLLTLLCALAAETNAQAIDFPNLNIQYDPDSRSVIVTGVPMYDAAGTIQYSLDGSIRFGLETVSSFSYAPEVMPYHLPDQQGYIFNWDDAQFLLPASGTYTFAARLTAHPRQNTGETLEKGPMQTLHYEYWKDGEAPVVTVSVKLDGDGGTFRDNQNRDCFDSSFPFEAGKTLSSAGYTIDRITCVDKDFRGWIAYDDSGKALSGLMTTEEVLNYNIPDHNIRFVMQWDKREGYPVTAITYAAIINGTGEPDPNVRVTLENNGIRYSGYGCVTISKEVYSQWKGNVKVIWECPGRYIQANNRWIPDYFESEGSVNGFKKEKSCYISISATGKGKEVISPRDTINELFYSARNTQPEISLAADSTVSAAGLPHTITAQQLQSGSIYDQSMAAMKKATLTDNVLVYDITARNGKNVFVHQLDSTAEVTIQLPESYTIQSGSTALVYHLPGDGTAVPCDTTYDAENRSLTFRTDHFSLYAVSEVAKAPEPPKQPDMPANPPTNPVQPDMPCGCGTPCTQAAGETGQRTHAPCGQWRDPHHAGGAAAAHHAAGRAGQSRCSRSSAHRCAADPHHSACGHLRSADPDADSPDCTGSTRQADCSCSTGGNRIPAGGHSRRSSGSDWRGRGGHRSDEKAEKVTIPYMQKCIPCPVGEGCIFLFHRLFQRFQIAPHQREIGDAVLQLLPGHIVAAVEQGRFCAGGFGNAVRHQMIGKLDIVDGGELLLPHQIGEIRNGGGGRLRLGGTAGEGCIAGDAVGLGKVAQGETVTEHHHRVGHGIHIRTDLSVQSHQFRQIRIFIGGVDFGVGLVHLHDLRADVLDDLHGVDGGRPHVLVHLHHLSVAVVMIVIVLHALQRGFLQRGHAVDHPQRLHRLVQRGEDGIHPRVGLAAQIHEQVAVLHRQNIPGGRLIGMALRAGGQQQLHLRQITGDGSRQVIAGEVGGDDLQPSVLPTAVAAAGGDSQQQRQHRCQSQQFSSHGAPLTQTGNRQIPDRGCAWSGSPPTTRRPER